MEVIVNVTQFEGWKVGDVCAALLERGWKNLGKGQTTWCFGKRGSGRVVKVVCGDEGQRRAIELFRENQDVEAFPRLYSAAELAEGCFVYEMERLQEQTGDFDLVRVEWRCHESLVEVFGPDVAALLESVAEDLNTGVDLHDENIMLRKDGTLVAVDPFYIGSNKAAKGEVVASLRQAA
jgi:hypothetical protein